MFGLNRKKEDSLYNFDNPKQAGYISLILALISLIIFPLILSLLSIGYGAIGTFYSVKRKAGITALLLNVMAVLVGLVSLGLNLIY